jgi:Protein ChrB, N-terminal
MPAGRTLRVRSGIRARRPAGHGWLLGRGWACQPLSVELLSKRLRRWYRTIRARDVFGAPSAPVAERRLKECAEALEAFAEQVYQARERP